MMKKLLLLTLALVMAMSMSAKKKYITLQSGDVQVLNQPGKTALYEFDYSKTICEGKPLEQYLKDRGEENVRDWPGECIETQDNYFMPRWNDESKMNISLIKEGKADYKIVVHVTDLDLGSTAAAMFIPSFSRKTGACEVSATVDVIDLSNNQTVCVLNVNKLRGVNMRAFEVASSETRRRGLTYKKMAQLICEFAQESNK
ncbi:hypothetical protein [Prevotella sp. kh1p2]|uniref:hypothetical protein n=1 Tax=Prevotella sp. kh1p2 TaxID=1761883 RepID=UPI00115FCE49|nr:hypothetical protein [Prevotella sp. kh1p2]